MDDIGWQANIKSTPLFLVVTVHTRQQNPPPKKPQLSGNVGSVTSRLGINCESYSRVLFKPYFIMATNFFNDCISLGSNMIFLPSSL